MDIKGKVREVRDWMKYQSGGGKGFILGISGGKDSTVTAALLVKAVGADKVFGVIMPNGVQKDIDDAIRVCNLLNIKYKIVNIEEIYKDTVSILGLSEESDAHTLTNIPPRLRMTVLYALGQSMGYRVVGTGNNSERFVGYFTKHGDGACDVNFIKDILCTDVMRLGIELGLPKELCYKTPTDGLCGKTDEDNLGFTYEQLDNFIKNGDSGSLEIDEKIRRLRIQSLHKVS